MAKNEWQKTNHCAPPPLLYDFIFEWWGGGGIEKFLYVAGPKVENIFQRDQKLGLYRHFVPGPNPTHSPLKIFKPK